MKTFIQSRERKKIVVLVDGENNTKGLAFVMHGLGGFKEQPHVETFVQAFLEKGFTVVRFDTRDTFGESEGSYENATIGSYYQDLEDIIGWSESQPWYREPFALAGHSLGGICTALYAERYPEKVKALAPVSTVVSGQISLEANARLRPEEFKKWRETGWREVASESKPGVMKRLPWSNMEERLKYDLIPEAKKLSMPVLLIVGEDDDRTPPDSQKILFTALPGPKELHIIKGAPHTFRDPAHLQEIKEIMLKWISSFPA